MQHPTDRISAPQDAVLCMLSRIVRATPESKDSDIVAKLLFSKQIGCLFGKGGSIIAEMRKVTGAYIRILGKDLIPKCASENEEVVQINGDFEAVQVALLHTTARLRNHFFRESCCISFYQPSFDRAFIGQGPPFGSFMGRTVGGNFHLQECIPVLGHHFLSLIQLVGCLQIEDLGCMMVACLSCTIFTDQEYAIIL